MSKLSDADSARADARRQKSDHSKVEPNLGTIAREAGGEVELRVQPKLDLRKLLRTIEGEDG